MDIREIYKIFQKKYPLLNNVNLKIIKYNVDIDYEGKCVYDTLNDYIIDGKSRYCNIKVLSIEIVDHGDKIFTLLHEMAHALSLHYERKIKDEYVYIEHSHLFYNKFMELIKYAYDNHIINKLYDIKKLKLVDKCK